MGRPLLLDVIRKPLTSFVIAICTIVWIYIQKKSIGYGDVGVSYDSIVVEKQYWRIITATFSHISFLHLAFNMSSLWSLGVVERLKELGAMAYLKYTLVLVVMSEMMAVGMYHILIHRFRLEHYKRVTAVGYSCVVFGWMAILSQKVPTSKLDIFGVLSLPINFAPFESLVFTSIIVPQASFIGHLAGLIVGYLISFGLFSSLNNYWTLNFALWIALIFVVSLKLSGNVEMPYLQIETLVDTTTPNVVVERDNVRDRGNVRPSDSSTLPLAGDERV